MNAEFHFLRPWWLVALIPVVVLWWLMRRHSDAARTWRGIVAPHLLPHLLSGQEGAARFGPLNLVALGWVIAIVALAGPAFRREPSPFAEETATLAIVVRVSPSMMTEDVQPSRLTRATEKIQDLVKRRGGAKTALIAYAGTAHVVMPATTDGGIIASFAQALNPKIMPRDGDAAARALRLADATLTDAGGGSILWITDAIAPEQNDELLRWRQGSRTEVRLLAPLLPGEERDAIERAADPVRAEIVALTADDTDVAAIASAAKFANVAGGDDARPWEDSGYWLTPLLAALLLPFFRRGWMVQTAATT